MNFLYFLPGQQLPIATPESAAEHGLAYVFDDDTAPTPNRVQLGPDGSPGCICSRGDRVQYSPAEQIWKPIHEHPNRACVGFWKDSRPTPDSLARTELLAGQVVQLDDGTRWQVPIAVRWTEHGYVNVLPRLKTRDMQTGQWVLGDVRAKYRHLWNFLQEFWGDLVAANSAAKAAGQSTYSYPPSHERLAFAALTANYRVTEAELDVLGLIDTAFAERISAIVCNDAEWDAIQKKTPTA